MTLDDMNDINEMFKRLQKVEQELDDAYEEISRDVETMRDLREAVKNRERHINTLKKTLDVWIAAYERLKDENE